MSYQKPLSYFEETTESSDLIYDGKVLHVYKDDIRLPDGGHSMREYCRHNGAVAVVPLTGRGEVVCVRHYCEILNATAYYTQASTGVAVAWEDVGLKKIDDLTLEIPAGKFDYVGEDHEAAALRELQEETGYTPARLTPIGNLATSPALLTEIIYMYLAEDLTLGETHPDDDEFLEIVHIPLSDLVDMILRGEVEDSKTQAAVLKVWAMKQQENI